MEKKTNDDMENMNPENGAIDAININADENISGTNHLNEPVSNDNEVEMLKNEVDLLKDKYLRQAAEFDNFRKRTSRERLELIQTAGKDVVSSLLEVLDDCDRAEAQLAKSNEPDQTKEGILLVFQKLRSKLQARGLKVMDSIGKDFDPDQHEAITEVPVPGAEMKGKVIDVLEKGYYLNDKIIRYAKVVVGK